jgi:hypothetical protein
MNEMILDLTTQLTAIRRPSFEAFLKKTRPEYYAQMIKEKQLADEEARQWKKDIINGIINAEGEPL